MKFSYTLEGFGCSNAFLEINNHTVEFDLSYVGMPMFDLLEGLAQIMPGYDRSGDISEINFNWLGEPNGWKWELKMGADLDLHIKITYDSELYHTTFTDIEGESSINFHEDREIKIVLDTHCNYFDFVKLVLDEFSKVLKKHGLIGISQSWGDALDFSTIDFIKLKHFLQTKKAFDGLEFDAEVNPEGKFKEKDKSIFDYEMELLMS